MDVHPAHRFRIVLAHVEEIVLEVCSDHVGLGEEQYTRLRTYKNIVDGLATDGYPTLWPSLKRSRLDMNIPQPPGSGTYRYPSCGQHNDEPTKNRPDDTRLVIDAVFAHMYPDHLTVNLPPPPSNLPSRLSMQYCPPPVPSLHGVGGLDPMSHVPPEAQHAMSEWSERFAEYESSCTALRGLRANHVVVHGFLSQEHALPIATSSLVVFFAESFEWEKEEPTNDVGERLYPLLIMAHLFEHVDTVTIWNVLGCEPNEYMDEYMDDFMWRHVEIATQPLSEYRVNKGNQRDLRITIMPAGYVEGGENETEPSTEIFVVSLRSVCCDV
jgi:hypothetical protein